MLEGDESLEPTWRDVGHDRWLAMQSAYAEYKGASEALECTRQSANESSTNERSLLTIAVDRQRVASNATSKPGWSFWSFASTKATGLAPVG